MATFNTIQAHTVDSRSLSFKDNLFVAEISDFGPGFRFKVEGGFPTFSIQSKNTGQIKKFKYVSCETNADHEVTSWFFRCVDANLRHLEARIFND